MRTKRTMTACVALAMVVFASAGLAGNAGTKEARSVTFKGKVVDEQGRPIAGVKVTLDEMTYDEVASSFASDPTGQVETQADGMFSFSREIGTGTYRYGNVVAEREGLAMGPVGWDMRTDKEFEIKLGPPKDLAGVVVDENDKPVADAEVSIPMLIIGAMQDQQGLAGPAALQRFTVRTDAAGGFRFTGIPAEATAELFVRKPGRATVFTYQRITSGSQKLNYAAGRTDIKLVLPAEAKIEGIVVERSSGKPIAAVQMRCTNGRELGYSGPRQLVSKEDGTFSIDALAPDRYMLELVQPRGELPDWVAEPVEVVTEAGKSQSGIKVELGKGGILEVVVRDAATRQPVEEASVSIERQASGQYVRGSSGQDGIARLRLLPGAYRISYLSKQGYSQRILQDTVTIEEGKTERLEYDLGGIPKIAGVVRDEKGAPIAGAKLRICPRGQEDVVSDAEGRFEVVGDAGGWPGREPVVAFLVGRDEAKNLAAAVQIEEDTRTVDITLKPAVILAGKVVDPNGKAIARARITPMLRASNWGSSITRDRIVSDAQGKFEIRAVPPEQKYGLYIIADGYGQNRSEQIDAAGAVNNCLDMGNVTLPIANLSVSGVVVDSDDKPVAGARLNCSGDGQPFLNVQSDIDGKFTLEKVCAGRIRISADKTGTPRLYGFAETEGGATDVRIVIGESSSVSRYEPRQPPSLVGKPLRELKEVGIDLPQAETDGKMLLVCFWDMEQRPSRYCLTQLAKQAEQLKEKGVTVVAVHASKVEQNALDEYVKKYNVPFSVGMVQGDVEKARFAWGVKSLPWLILTDRRHVVSSAGFGVSELEARIKAVKD